MAVYILGFAASVGLIAFSEKKRWGVFAVCSVLALLIPCLIAGLRAQNIGTDVMVYVKPMAKAAAMSDDLGDYFNSYWFLEWRNLYLKDYDIGFSLMVYLVTKLTHSLAAVLFVIQALVMVPVYVALARNRKKMPVWLGMLVFYLLFYNSTLNMMRQWIAMSFLLLAFQLLQERKGFSVAAMTVVAFLFHSTAVVALPLYLVYWLLLRHRRFRLEENRLSVSASVVMAGLLFVVGMLALMNLQLVIKLLSSIGLQKFNSYLEGEEMQLMAGQIALRVPQLLVLLLCWKSLQKQEKATPFFLAMLLLDMVASQLVSVDVNAIRISNYFSMYTVFWIPMAIGSVSSPVKRRGLTLLVIGYGLVYWYYFYIMTARHQTYPYAFALFG